MTALALCLVEELTALSATLILLIVWKQPIFPMSLSVTMEGSVKGSILKCLLSSCIPLTKMPVSQVSADGVRVAFSTPAATDVALLWSVKASVWSLCLWSAWRVLMLFVATAICLVLLLTSSLSSTRSFAWSSILSATSSKVASQ